VVLGGDNHRIHEELISAGGRLREGRFARLNVTETNAALDKGLPDPAPEAVQRRILEIAPSHRDALMSALETRMKDRTENLESIIQRRTEREVDDMTQVLQELDRNIRQELKAYDGPEQLHFEGWSTAEQEQFQRNVDSIRARLAQIPDEVEREAAAIRRRYANPSPRLFPVAVTYLVPQKLAREMERTVR
jgi:hypothetical protein